MVFLLAIAFSSLYGCTPNSPYRTEEEGSNFFYTTFDEPPKHLDPARAYSADEYDFICQIYEPLLQYHYLKRPYGLVPLTTESVPTPVYADRFGRRLPQNAPAEKVYRAQYALRIKDGIMYQEHPAFVKKKNGDPLYSNLAKKDLVGIDSPNDFKEKASRRLSSDDYIYQIKRLADPLLESPVLPILEKYILGLDEYAGHLRAELEGIRGKRKAAAGPSYNQALDEKENPIRLDYDGFRLPGVEKIDDRAFRIILKTKYPQFAYWLAMPFFSPVAREVDEFYKQGALVGKNITLDRFPVGTGPYMIETFKANMEMVLSKNKGFRGERYPQEGEKEDVKNNLLVDSGHALPFIEKIVFKLEKEAIPRWNKFLQGYFDNSGISSDSFDQAVTITDAGGAELTDEMSSLGIRLITSVRPSIHYSGFNMLDDTFGGYSDRARKLRQAISIALDYEEFIEIFANGRGFASMSPIPPGIFGHIEGRHGVNPFVYDWDEDKKRPVRKSIEYAKALMKEAGWPNGRDKDGRPLILRFDNPWTGADASPIINWHIKRLSLLGIQMENRTTDYNRFQEKMLKGNSQFFSWGWNADYPDPENFFFLLNSANSKVLFQGENVANYANPEFDALFKKMESMDNTPERLAVIRRMSEILQRDSPWVWGYHPVAFGLYHSWVKNVKSNAMANNTLKYLKIDAVARATARRSWNRPRLWPVLALVAVLAISALPAMMAIRKRHLKGRK
ncbi:MAG: ABC transporter substrate-binding protein [Deltaproteobacteria bacterium]